jgi:hypothetical protein
MRTPLARGLTYGKCGFVAIPSGLDDAPRLNVKADQAVVWLGGLHKSRLTWRIEAEMIGAAWFDMFRSWKISSVLKLGERQNSLLAVARKRRHCSD